MNPAAIACNKRSQREMARDLVAVADIAELRLAPGIGADGGPALGFKHGTARGKAAAGEGPFEIEHAPDA